MNARASLSVVVTGLIALVLAASGCGYSASSESNRREVMVYAASSLTEAFQALEREFERAHPDVDVRLTFAGSQVLRLQLEHGANADVFASANESHMTALVDAGVVSQSQTFARNELALIVPSDNPAAVHSFTDLRHADHIVIGSENVPVGIYTRQVLAHADRELGRQFVSAVRDRVVSEESNARLVRAKVELGEADAAIVYLTDAVASRHVEVVAIPDALNVRASLPIGRLAHANDSRAAQEFIAFVVSAEGRRVLDQHGFVTDAP